MLETLRIKNIAIIDEVEIPFKKGLNILSGETGAGKSIVIESISLILGGRASLDLIRAGCDEAQVEGLFDLSSLPWMQQRLKQAGFESESAELLIKRSVNRNGKHRIYINGELATHTILSDLCEGLVDLCGQHEHQSLLKSKVQLELLDRYGALIEKAQSFATHLNHYRSLKKEKAVLESLEAERSKKMDFLKFQIQELKDAAVVSGEDDALSAEKMLLQSVGQRGQLADQAFSLLNDETEGLLVRLGTCSSKLKQLSSLDQPASELCAFIERAGAELDEAARALSRYTAKLETNPNRLEEVQTRLSLITSLKRKYGPTLKEVEQTLNRIENEAHDLEQNETRLHEMDAKVAEITSELFELAKKLSTARKKIAKVFSDSVNGELKDLKMSEALFQIHLEPEPSLDHCPTSGMDLCQFQVRTNLGDEAKALGKIASGGELSRLMLAIRRVISDRGGIGVYLFDEIDAGIGGQTAFQVGKKLKSVAEFNQVICITHLPQVASFADHHLSVSKKTKGAQTLTEIETLSMDERKKELARMLGGAKLTPKSLENAAELLEMAR